MAEGDPLHRASEHAHQPQPQPLLQRAGTISMKWRTGVPRTILFLVIGILIAIGAKAYHFRHNGQESEPMSASQKLLNQGDETTLALPLSLISERDVLNALARTALSSTEKERLRVALKKDDIRLAIMPLGILKGDVGASLTILGAGFRQEILLGAEAREVILPISHRGEIEIRTLRDENPAGLTLGVGTIYGVAKLSPLFLQGDGVLLRVIIQ